VTDQEAFDYLKAKGLIDWNKEQLGLIEAYKSGYDQAIKDLSKPPMINVPVPHYLLPKNNK
jgi:hypothetical protein